jgi:hypothetical protein
MNKYRGSFDIEIDGKKFTLTPSFDAMENFEEKVGMSVIQALQKIEEGSYSVRIIAGAIWAGILGEAYYRNDSKLEQPYRVIGEMVRKVGVVGMANYAQQFLTYASLPAHVVEKIEADVPQKKTDS